MSAPSPSEMVQELREALGMYAGAMPCSPKEAWEQALDRARTLTTGRCHACIDDWEPPAIGRSTDG